MVASFQWVHTHAWSNFEWNSNVLIRTYSSMVRSADCYPRKYHIEVCDMICIIIYSDVYHHHFYPVFYTVIWFTEKAKYQLLGLIMDKRLLLLSPICFLIRFMIKPTQQFCVFLCKTSEFIIVFKYSADPPKQYVLHQIRYSLYTE